MSTSPNPLTTFVSSVQMESEPAAPKVNLRNTHIAAVSALLYVAGQGMLTSYSAPATADMMKPGSRFRDVTTDQITWIGSLQNLGCVLGNFLSGYFSHKFGRKGVMIFSSLFYVFSWLMVAFAPTIPVMYAGRLIGGICAGLCQVAVPAYVVEISTTETRGKLSTGFQLAYTTGVLTVMGLGIVMRWSWIAVTGAIVISVAVSLMAFMPESPPWLISQKRPLEALEGLKFLKGKDSDPKKELQIITDNLAQQQQGMDLREFLKPQLYKPTIIALSLMFFQQACGISPLMAYTVEILHRAGSVIDPTVAATVIALVQVIGCIVSGFFMDKTGRKRLYIISGSCVTIALIALGVYSLVIKYYATSSPVVGYIPLLCFVVYIFTFSLGIGPIPYVMIPEMTPLRFRSTVIAMAGVWASFLAFLFSKVYEDMRSLMGDYGVYWTYGFFSVISAGFGYFLLPETKGLTFRQISRSFDSSNKASF